MNQVLHWWLAELCVQEEGRLADAGRYYESLRWASSGSAVEWLASG